MSKSSYPFSTRLQKFRILFFLIGTVVRYLFFLFLLFVQGKILTSLLPFILLYFFLLFLSIDLRNFKFKWVWLGVGVFFLLALFFIPPGKWYLLLAIVLILVMIVTVIFIQKRYFSKVKKIYRLGYFGNASTIFTFFATIIYALIIMGLNSQFPFDCEQILKVNDRIIEIGMTPVEQTESAGKSLIKKIRLIFKNDQNLSSVEESAIVPLESLPNPESTGEGNFLQKITHSLTDRSTSITQEIQTAQREINLKVCKSILDQIKRIYENSVVQIVAIFLIYLLLSGIARFVVMILNYIVYFFFLLLKLLGTYPTHKVMQEVEELK